ncbi:MAG: Flp family type IVb pilin [Dehalococcoidia bacterium]|nr:Flp family type IVb pilin [Dehalococcoidia bacterium]
MVRLMRGSDKDEEGQTLVEYGLIIALLSIVLIGVLGLLGDELENVFTEVKDALAGTGTP